MDIRQQAWELRQQGYSYAEIAKKLGIGKSTVYKYVKQWEAELKREPDNDKIGTTHDTKNGEYDVDRNSIPSELQNYVESGEPKLKVVGVDEVVSEINKKITIVDEPSTKIKRINEEKPNITNTVKHGLNSNVVFIVVTIIAVIGIAVAVYFWFFRKTDEPKIDKKVEEQKKEVVEKRTNPQAESTYDHVSRYGIKDKVVVL